MAYAEAAKIVYVIYGFGSYKVVLIGAEQDSSHFKHKYSCVSKEEHDYRFDVFKVDIMEHRLYEKFVSAHLSCLRIVTLVD
ncbi:unnamed protein product [Malus baccata var. baccata]